MKIFIAEVEELLRRYIDMRARGVSMSVCNGEYGHIQTLIPNKSRY